MDSRLKIISGKLFALIWGLYALDLDWNTKTLPKDTSHLTQPHQDQIRVVMDSHTPIILCYSCNPLKPRLPMLPKLNRITHVTNVTQVHIVKSISSSARFLILPFQPVPPGSLALLLHCILHWNICCVLNPCFTYMLNRLWVNIVTLENIGNCTLKYVLWTGSRAVAHWSDICVCNIDEHITL